MANPQVSTVATANENTVPGGPLYAYAPKTMLPGQFPVFADATGRTVASWDLPTNASGGAATTTLTSSQSGQVFLMDTASGNLYNLPAPVVGLEFFFVVTTSVTSNNHKVLTDANTTFIQGAVMESTVGGAANMYQGNGSTHRSVTMNGTTTGGLIGTALQFSCITATQWQVVGFNLASGTIATPFATS